MKSKLPNIIFIVMDTVAAKHMSLYGYHRNTTPNIEQIAKEATVYPRCFAPACWTIPSHASMFTGLYPSQHGAHEGNIFLTDKVHHLIPSLKMMGYYTYGISSNTLVSPATGLCPGFDHFEGFGTGSPPDSDLKELLTHLAQGAGSKEKLSLLLTYLREKRRFDVVLRKVGRSVESRLNRLLRRMPFFKSSPFTEQTRKLFRSFLDHSAGMEHPFFLFINFLEAHEKYRPPFKWRQFSHWNHRQSMPMTHFYERGNSDSTRNLLQTNLNLYDDELYYLDHVIGGLWQDLQQSQLADNTVFILTSDHGEHFGEKGDFSHISSLYNELIWVPLIIRFPDSPNKPRVDDRLVSLNDLYSTVLDLAQVPLPRPKTSFSLLGDARREFALAQLLFPEMWAQLLKWNEKFSKVVYQKFSPASMAVITKEDKKIIEKQDGTLEIYNLREDMEENHNLVPGMPPDTLANFKNLMEYFKEETGFQDLRATFNGIEKAAGLDSDK